jgi:putative N6-adenine-specific DNA methylase
MKLIAKTLFGLEKVLAEELESLGAGDVRPANRAVLFEGNSYLLYRVNYCSRLALSILASIAEFRIGSSNDLYNNGMRLEWDKYLNCDDTFSVVPVVNSKIFRHTGYAGLLLKDSIADWFSKRFGKRPSVDTTDPKVVINLHISNDTVNVSLDSSVVPLFKRGYRKEQFFAPLNEVLAAGMIKLSSWDSRFSIVDPMCGSGTIPIEACLIAHRIPPGKFRSFFGFQRWKGFDYELFEKVRKEADKQIINSQVKIYASDISDDAVSKARSNILNAGLNDLIYLEVSDFKNIKPKESDSFVFINPPYGKRIKTTVIEELYSMIGSTLKHNFAGSTALIITADREALKHVGLKPIQKNTLFNGALECTFVKYEMYQGTRKKNR